jgi:uncharacterized membrane protein YkoI
LLAAVITLSGLAAATAAAQPIKGSATLKKEARVKGDSARKIALAQVPNGKITSAELERENGKLVYEFLAKVPGKTGVEEVKVDAADGSVVSNQHTTMKAVREEERAEKAAMKPAAKPAKPKP